MNRLKLPVRKIRRPTRKELIKKEIHGEHFVWWNDLSKGEIAKIKKALQQAKGENDIQIFLEEHPRYLAVKLGGGHGRWIIPKKSLSLSFNSEFPKKSPLDFATPRYNRRGKWQGA